jgi:hypothetical protein
MLQFGICDVDDYRPLSRGPFRRLRAALQPRVSLQLLRTGMPPTARELAVFEHLTEIPVSNGVFRTTYRGRFADIDPIVNSILSARYPHSAEVVVHDWAASSCLTSAEWARTLFTVLPRASLTASDLLLFLVEVTLPSGEVFVVESQGHPLQYIRRPFVIRLDPPEPMVFLINRILGRKASARLTALQIEIPEAWLASENEELLLPFAHLRKIPLTHSEARELGARDSRFSICRHSAFDALRNPVDVIRTINIYNRCYFAVDALRQGVRAVWSSLRTGGVWILGRTLEGQEPTHHATVFEKTEQDFRVLERFGDGSEIENLALSSDVPPC